MTTIDSFLKKNILKTIFVKSDGTSIFEEKWDNLIILDACRYDIFSRLIKKFDINYKLEYRFSRGSDTTEFLIKNFNHHKKYNDIVYVTANPFVNIILKNKVYKIIPVWDFGWNDRYKTVLPETMYYYALKSILKYQDKRLIIHFIQPHHPYITYKFESMEKALEELRYEGKISKLRRNFLLKFKLRRILRVIAERKIYPNKFYIEIDQKKHLKAYVDNLKLALPYVKKLIHLLPGKTVITADHGEAFGEKIHPLIPIRVYGHLPEIRIPALIKVPWLIVDEKYKLSEKCRKKIIKDELEKSELYMIKLKIRRLSKNLK